LGILAFLLSFVGLSVLFMAIGGGLSLWATVLVSAVVGAIVWFVCYRWRGVKA
jgi:hypothetical protein